MEWISVTFLHIYLFKSLFNIHYVDIHDVFCVIQLSFYLTDVSMIKTVLP